MSYKDKEKNREYQRRWRQRNPEKAKAYQSRHGMKLKLETLSYYSQGIPKCVRCRIDDIDVLCIDHINGGGNQHRKALRFPNGCGKPFYRWLRQNNFPDSYQVLCFNCNMKKQIREHC